MIQYILPFLAYILPGFLIKDIFLAYEARIILTSVLLVLFWKKYKLKFSLNFLSAIAGILIFLAWIFIQVSFKATNFQIYGYLFYIKIAGFILVTPLVEELFTRDFLIRMTIAIEKKVSFEKVKIGTFTLLSFIVSAAFFGFSHYMWLAGLISAVILNLTLYKTKNITSCILAHAIANLLVAIYILKTSSWWLW